jgi:Fe-S-cluster-containing dehydrogenase component
MTKGILINYDYCTGCHSCEVACKKILDLPKGEFGIKLSETGPYQYTTGRAEGKWEWAWLPVVTKACDMCEDRVAKGKMAMCVQHCQAWCMYYGEAEDLVKKMDGKTRWALFTQGE